MIMTVIVILLRTAASAVQSGISKVVIAVTDDVAVNVAAVAVVVIVVLTVTATLKKEENTGKEE